MKFHGVISKLIKGTNNVEENRKSLRRTMADRSCLCVRDSELEWKKSKEQKKFECVGVQCLA